MSVIMIMANNRIRVTVSDKFKTVEDIGRMRFRDDADQLRLSDIARIVKIMKTLPATTFYDRQRAIGIMVVASPDILLILKWGHRVEKKLEQI